MRNTFFGLEMARRAMAAHRTYTDVVGHNISNANTEGYRKQDVVLSPTRPHGEPGSIPLGTGVKVSAVKRRQDLYLEREIHRRRGEASMWETRHRVLTQVEDILAEPTESGISSVINEFFNSWHDLATEADNPAVRQSVLERAKELGDAFQLADRQLENMMANLQQTISSRVDRVNEILRQLGNVSEQIIGSEAAGLTPNDLLDRRDGLVEELSSLIDVSARPQEEGGVQVTVDGVSVVDSYIVRQLEMDVAGDDPGQVEFSWSREKESEVQWSPSESGELGALVQLRNEDVPDMRGSLRELAQGIKEEVNVQHRTGYGLSDDPERDFFDAGADPGVLRVREALLEDPDRIRAAANSPAMPGDGENALAIAHLQDEAEVGPGGASPGEYLRGKVAELGVACEQAEKLQDNNDAMLTQLLNQRDAVTGVSIDEELTHLIQAQNAFRASARLVSVWDEMLNTLVNGLVR